MEEPRELRRGSRVGGTGGDTLEPNITSAYRKTARSRGNLQEDYLELSIDHPSLGSTGYWGLQPL